MSYVFDEVNDFCVQRGGLHGVQDRGAYALHTADAPVGQLGEGLLAGAALRGLSAIAREALAAGVAMGDAVPLFLEKCVSIELYSGRGREDSSDGRERVSE
jgi:hypothetical protein